MGYEQRISLTTDHQLDKQLADLETELQQLRGGAPQFIGGSSIKWYESTTGNIWDWTGTITNKVQYFQIDATAATMDVFWGTAMHYLYVGSPTSLYDGLAYMTDVKTLSGSQVDSSYTNTPAAGLQFATKSWIASFATSQPGSSKSAWLRFMVIGLDTATVTVTALN